MDRLTAARVFLTIAERGSMTAAADALDMSRAMVTRYLAEMESWSEQRLLHRTTRKLSLTPAGEQALARCRQMLEIASEMTRPAGERAGVPRGMLRISCAQSLAEGMLAPAVAAYLQRYPETAVDLHIASQAVNLVEARIDLAIRITNDLDPNLIARPLGRCASVICAAPAYLAERGTPRNAQDLAVHNCLTYSYFGKSLWQLERAGETLAVPVQGNLSANESTVLLSAAVAGAGISMQPWYAAAPLLRSGQLVPLLTGWQPQTLGIFGVYASRRQMPAILRTMLDFLAAHFAAEPGWQAAGTAARRPD